MGQQKKAVQTALSFDSLYQVLSPLFTHAPDVRGYGCSYTLSDILRSGFAIYSLKNPSLLSFGHRSRSEVHNLGSIYGIKAVCSDNCLRTTLDEVSPAYLQHGFSILHQVLAKHQVLKSYQFGQKHLLVSIDGVEHFRSERVSCPHCLRTQHSDGRVSYYHQMLVAVVVHPDQQAVFPLGCEPIIQQDGQEKNDCERNAAKRLLKRLHQQYPHYQLMVIEDGLYSNGPHLEQLADLDQMPYIIGAKPDDHKILFRQFEARVARGKAKSHQMEDEKGFLHEFEWANNLPLNHTYAHIRVNLLCYKQTDPKGKQTKFSWIVHRKITQRNVYQTMRAARARWKIENETFNTLKNQGYHFEHNFGHGTKHLATVLAILMLLAFMIDQIQLHASKTFKLILQGLKTRKKMWQALKNGFTMKKAKSMDKLWRKIAREYQIKWDTS